MTLFRSLIGFLAITLIIISCKKEHSIEGAELPGPEESSWEFRESGTLFNGPMDSAFFQSVGTISTLSLIGSSSDNSGGDIFMQIVGENLTAGTYTNPLVFFQYSENGSVIYQSSTSESGGFTITITELDSFVVSGTFSGSAQDLQGNIHTIAEGKFNAFIITEEENTDPDPVITGQLTVWSKAICTDGGPIQINVDGQTGQITDGMIIEPGCGASGTAIFTLTAGDHTVEAICENDTLWYNVTVTENCNFVEVNFEDPPELNNYLPLVEGSYWEYNDQSDPGMVQRITAEGKEVLDNSREYTKLTSDLGDVFYYRKDQNAYYQYRVLDFQGYVLDPPSIEIPILYDDRDAGETWETAGEDIILSNIQVKMKLVFTITGKGYSQSYNGVEYTDLIEVKTEIFFSSDGGNTYQSSESAYFTVFAKDKGIVYYDDLDRSIGWGITSIQLNP